MASQRKLIRAAVTQRLKDAATAAGQRVFPSRAARIFPNELPAILVYTDEEPADISTEAPREYKRDLRLTLELMVMGPGEASLDDALDDLCEQVEAAIFQDETFGGLVSDTILVNTEQQLLSEGEKPIAGAKINLTMPYFQYLPGDLTSALDPLEGIDTEIKPPEFTANTPKTEDDVDLPQGGP